ncbi:MAG: hypothetical protein KDB37_02700 [Ilumatobacter sp.]|nr:hypothetical protein [Ilumatobacter sp.]
MPTLRHTDPDGRDGFTFRSRLPLGSRAATVPFLIDTLRIKRSLDAAVDRGDLYRYELGADLVHNVFTTDSTWVDEAAFGSWVGTALHRRIMSKYGDRLGTPTFERIPARPANVG